MLKRWIVMGTTTVSVSITCDAESAEEAEEIAGNEFGGLTGFVGNGGTDKLVGVYPSDDVEVSLEPCDGFDISSVEEVEA